MGRSRLERSDCLASEAVEYVGAESSWVTAAARVLALASGAAEVAACCVLSFGRVNSTVLPSSEGSFC